MLADSKNAELYCEWVEYIADPKTKDAFRYLVGFTAGLRKFRCDVQFKGVVREFRFFKLEDEQHWFSFIPTKKWLLFYFRAPAVRSGRYSFAELKKVFDTALENNRAEWTVKIRNIEDARRLAELLRL